MTRPQKPTWSVLVIGARACAKPFFKCMIQRHQTYPNTISVYWSSTKLLHLKTVEGMGKLHLGKHSTWGPCSCSGWHPRHSLHLRWSRTSILAFFWHGKVTGHEGIPAEQQPEVVNIYFQACCFHSMTNTWYTLPHSWQALIHYCFCSKRIQWMFFRLEILRRLPYSYSPFTFTFTL